MMSLQWMGFIYYFIVTDEVTKSQKKMMAFVCFSYDKCSYAAAISVLPFESALKMMYWVYSQYMKGLIDTDI